MGEEGIVVRAGKIKVGRAKRALGGGGIESTGLAEYTSKRCGACEVAPRWKIER